MDDNIIHCIKAKKLLADSYYLDSMTLCWHSSSISTYLQEKLAIEQNYIDGANSLDTSGSMQNLSCNLQHINHVV